MRRRVRRGRGTAREGQRRGADRDLLRRPRRAARAGSSVRCGEPDRPEAGPTRSTTTVFSVHLHVRTGPPKACMIRHRNYYSMVAKADEMEDRLTEPSDIALLYLPLAHNYGRLLTSPAHTSASRSRSCPGAATELVRVRPTLFRACRVYEKIHTVVVAGFEEQTERGRRSSNGPCAWAARLQAAPGQAAGAVRARAAAPGSPTANAGERQLGGRLRIAMRAVRRSRATSPSSSTRSTS